MSFFHKNSTAPTHPETRKTVYHQLRSAALPSEFEPSRLRHETPAPSSYAPYIPEIPTHRKGLHRKLHFDTTPFFYFSSED